MSRGIEVLLDKVEIRTLSEPLNHGSPPHRGRGPLNAVGGGEAVRTLEAGDALAGPTAIGTILASSGPAFPGRLDGTRPRLRALSGARRVPVPPRQASPAIRLRNERTADPAVAPDKSGQMTASRGFARASHPAVSSGPACLSAHPGDRALLALSSEPFARREQSAVLSWPDPPAALLSLGFNGGRPSCFPRGGKDWSYCPLCRTFIGT